MPCQFTATISIPPLANMLFGVFSPRYSANFEELRLSQVQFYPPGVVARKKMGRVDHEIGVLSNLSLFFGATIRHV